MEKFQTIVYLNYVLRRVVKGVGVIHVLPVITKDIIALLHVFIEYPSYATHIQR